jgi:membrane protease YdiL (CAAX protease family)
MTTDSMRSPTTMPAQRAARTGVKAYGILIVAAALGLAAIVPYSLALTGTSIPDEMFWQVVLVAVAQSLVFIAPLTALGLWLGPKVGLGAPLLYAWIEGRPGAGRDLLRSLPMGIGIGAVAGVVLLVAAAALMPWMPEELGQTPVPSWWQALLASVSAGITEELMLRLGLMTLVVWFGTKLTRGDHPSSRVVWSAIAVTALLFGAGHLPLAASLAPLTAMLVIRTLILNGFAGMVFGWLYWRYGLLAAMAAHISADVVLHVLSRVVLPS